MKRVTVLYTHFPHYRRAVFAELRRSTRYDYEFWYDRSGTDQSVRSAAAEATDFDVRTFQVGPLMFQPGFLVNALFGRRDACIMLGNPYIVSNWLYAAVMRARGQRVLLWTHGWRRREKGVKGWVRNAYYRLADMLLLYGDRAREIGIEQGFPARQLRTIYNSLDYADQAAHRTVLEEQCSVDPGLFLCVARLVPEVRIDMAILALAEVNRSTSAQRRLVIIGDGPERDKLAMLARSILAPVEFVGPIYNEAELARWFLQASAVLSPGKIGLLAMHAMAYGVPVITHDNFDMQMPEVEAIIPGQTGILFEHGNVMSLAAAMRSVASDIRAVARTEAIKIIESRYNPVAQRSHIERALDELLLV